MQAIGGHIWCKLFGGSILLASAAPVVVVHAELISDR